MNSISLLQDDFLSTKSAADRKVLGQFFTGAVVSGYMATLVDLDNKGHVRLLDAGAGAGMLTASVAKHCLESGCTSVHAALYELDEHVIPELEKTMDVITSLFNENNAKFTYEVKNEDFILARPDKDKSIQPYDVAVINPPYFKYSVKESSYAKATSDLYKGDPNIYASFMAVVLSSLSEHGQMVTISPRSFTNGLYFKGFRKYLLAESCLNLIHIFKSRDKVFRDKNSSVLQENIICKFVKGESNDYITVRSSTCDATI
ncbi:MAG: Eco57I restriction-modification methylase domain-containing protein, partial [Desulfobacteraceae bacterium]|nr:Eco57I restriction-modification methylase domain-containing protein [Desulfobacteraceae bacterium]